MHQKNKNNNHIQQCIPFHFSPWQCGGILVHKSTLLNKVIIFVAQKYSHRLIKLRLNHWSYMDYFNDVFPTFLGLESVSCVAVYGGGNHQKYLNLCSEDE